MTKERCLSIYMTAIAWMTWLLPGSPLSDNPLAAIYFVAGIVIACSTWTDKETT